MLAWDGAVAALEQPPRALPSATSAAARRSWSSARSRPGRLGALGRPRLAAPHHAAARRSDPPSAEAVEAARAAAAEAFEAVVPPVAQIGLAAGGTARALRRVVGTLDADGLTEAVAELSQLKRAKITKRYGVPPPRAKTLLGGAILFAEAQRRLGLPFELAGGGVREGSALALFRASAAAYA